MPRCRICDVEYLHPLHVLEDDLCNECELTVLEIISEWEMEDEEKNTSS